MTASALGTAPLWYVTRAAGSVSFGFGLAATKRVLASRAWPRFATQALHRNLSLLALGFLVVHVVTTLADPYVHVGWWSWIVPLTSGYRTFWVALGTLAFDLVVLLVATSLLRHRMSARSWRAIHWAAYAVWPLAFFHFLKTGTDAADGRWGLYLAVGCLMVLLPAAAARWLTGDSRARSLAGVRGGA